MSGSGRQRMLASRPSDLPSRMNTLIISNEEMNDITKIVKFLEESGLLIKGVSEIIKNEAKEQKGRFFSILLGTLGVSFLGNLLTGKGVMTAGEGETAATQGRGMIRVGHDF